MWNVAELLLITVMKGIILPAYTGCSNTKTTEQIIHQACQNHEVDYYHKSLLLKDTLKQRQRLS